MTDTTYTSEQYTRARHKLAADRRRPNALPSRQPMPIAMQAPDHPGYLSLIQTGEAMGASADAIRFRWKRGTLPFDLVRFGVYLYARVEDVAPYMTNVAANARYQRLGATESAKQYPETCEPCTDDTGEMEAA